MTVDKHFQSVRIAGRHLRTSIGAAGHGRVGLQQVALSIAVANRIDDLLCVPRVDLLDRVIAAYGVIEATFEHQETRVTEGQGGGQESVEPSRRVSRALSLGQVAPKKHVGAAHTEVAAQRMQFAKIEVDQPGTGGQIARLILTIIAVGQAAVVPVIVALAVDWSLPGLLLMQHDFAVRVERGGKRAGAGHAGIEISVRPRAHGRVHVTIGRVELEFFLNDRSQGRLQFHGARGLHVVAARPGRMPLTVRHPRDKVLIPELIDRCEIGVVVVDAVDEPQRSDLPRVLGLPRVASFARCRTRAHRETLAFVAPACFVVGDYNLRHAVAGDFRPQAKVMRAVRRPMRSPHTVARDVHPRRLGIGHIRQGLDKVWRDGDKQSLEDRIPRAVCFGHVPRTAVLRHTLVGHLIGEPELGRVTAAVIEQCGREERRIVRAGYENCRSLFGAGQIGKRDQTRSLRSDRSAHAKLGEVLTAAGHIHHERFLPHPQRVGHASLSIAVRQSPFHDD